MRLIDAYALSKSILEWLPPDPCGRPEMEHPFETDICVSMLMEIEDAPTIDAVEVVRCKDCKHRRENCGMGDHRWCDVLKMTTMEDDFCSYGKRREP